MNRNKRCQKNLKIFIRAVSSHKKVIFIVQWFFGIVNLFKYKLIYQQ